MAAPDSADFADDDVLGKTIAGKYQVLRVIGRGGMGAVYEAEHLALGKRVAIKFITREWANDDIVSNRFAREARAASVVESPHIVTVFDVGTEGGRQYFVMELLRGEDLGARLKRIHRIPLKDALHIVAQTLRGLSRAHEAGIVHRDLKPDNLFLVQAEGDASMVKIVDFGISKIKVAKSATIPLALTSKGTVLGTPFYMSPEQAQAKEDVDERADLYSVGAILFECLTGRVPHLGTSYEQVILAICMQDAPDLRTVAPNTPPEVCAFVKRALDRDRVQRFKTARQMLAALHQIAPEERVRVPLDAPEVLATMRSADPEEPRDTVVDPHAPTESRTERGATLPSRAERTNDTPPASSTTVTGPRGSPPPPPPVKSGGRVLLVALAATALGVGLAIVGMNAFAPRATIVVEPGKSVPEPHPSVSAPAPSSTPAPPSATASVTTATPPSAAPTQKRPAGGRPSASAKPLDLVRELPP